MGHSQTIHCIGETKDGFLYYAMNRLEIAQQRIISEREGRKIVSWHAQTRMGVKILGDEYHEPYYLIPDSKIPPVKTIKCVCEGRGCFICKGSGITTQQWINGFQSFQIEMARREAGTVKRSQSAPPENMAMMTEEEITESEAEYPDSDPGL